MSGVLHSKIEKELISHFSKKFSLTLKIFSVFPVSGGCICQAMMLDTNNGRFFLKLKSSGPEDLFLREEESLIELNKSSNEFLIFPKPLLAKKIDTLPGYLLTSFLETNATSNDDDCLGRGLATLHKYSAEKFGFQNDNYCGCTPQINNYQNNWFTFYSENRIGTLVKLISVGRDWTMSDSQLLNRFLSKIELFLCHQPKPSLIHGDLWSGNYMYTINGPALIDPAVSYCDREFEMGMMTLFGGFSKRVYDTYNEVYPLLHEWKERNKIYQLYHILNHYYLFGGSYKNRALELMKHYL